MKGNKTNGPKRRGDEGQRGDSQTNKPTNKPSASPFCFFFRPHNGENITQRQTNADARTEKKRERKQRRWRIERRNQKIWRWGWKKMQFKDKLTK